MRIRLITATAMALLLVAAPAASALDLPEQADDRAGNASQGLETAEDARDNGRDFGLDRAQEHVDERTPDEAEAGDALEHARQQGDDDNDA